MDSESQYPKVANILKKETYVDDILSWGFSIEETVKSENDLISVIKSAGFLLKKLLPMTHNFCHTYLKNTCMILNFFKFQESSSTKPLCVLADIIFSSAVVRTCRIDNTCGNKITNVDAATLA